MLAGIVCEHAPALEHTTLLAMWPAPTELLRDKHLRSAPSPLSDVSCCFLDVSNKRRAPQDSEVIYQICSRVHSFGPYVVF